MIPLATTKLWILGNYIILRNPLTKAGLGTAVSQTEVTTNKHHYTNGDNFQTHRSSPSHALDKPLNLREHPLEMHVIVPGSLSSPSAPCSTSDMAETNEHRLEDLTPSTAATENNSSQYHTAKIASENRIIEERKGSLGLLAPISIPADDNINPGLQDDYNGVPQGMLFILFQKKK